MEPMNVERPKPGNILELPPWGSTGRMKELEFDAHARRQQPETPLLERNGACVG